MGPVIRTTALLFVGVAAIWLVPAFAEDQTEAGNVQVTVKDASFHLDFPDCAIVRLSVANPGARTEKLLGATSDIPGAKVRVVTITHNLLEGPPTPVAAIPIPVGAQAIDATLWISGIPWSVKVGDEFHISLQFQYSGTKQELAKFGGLEMINTTDMQRKARGLDEAAKRARMK